ncbi:MAG: type II secretion protein ATPase [Alphaproteobacteria bacterium]|nr:type II secretion protein ATPase [Alphaproteobacteria bacterium]
MSEDDSTETSVLLPSASVAIFTKDKESVQTVSALEDDWRFARVRIEAIDGDVETAIEAYSSMASPDLVIVQTDEINDGFAGRLEALAGYCKEDTAAIVVGPVNDVYLYRKLIGMGVSDYLVRPLVPEVFSEVIAKTLIERIGAIGSHLVAFVGAKGGVGTSLISRLTAWGASERGQKSILLDAAGGWSSMSVGLGFDPTATLPEAMRVAQTGNEDNLKRMLVNPGEKLSVLATGGDVMLDHEPDPGEFENLVNILMTKYPIVFLDLSQAPAPVVRAMAAKANKIILVSTPVVTALRLARTLLSEIEELRGGSRDNISLVINMQNVSSAGEVARSDIEAAMERKPELFIPFNPKLFIGAEGQGQKFFENKATAGIIQDVVDLIANGIGMGRDEAGDSRGQQSRKGILRMFSPKE